MSLAAAVDSQGPSTRALYEKLEDRILDRDQVGSAEAYYDLVRGGRPLTEMLREAVRIHGPYTPSLTTSGSTTASSTLSIMTIAC